ncbi:MAG: hypothetical protein SNJ76_11080 [Fimbriimonadaceae bacterium]
MDSNKKTILAVVVAAAAIAVAVFAGVKTVGGDQPEVVGTLQGVSKEAEMGNEPSDPSKGPAGDMSDAPIVKVK